MKKNNVKIINISLSSKKYSLLLENYIDENKNDLIIFSSYNNMKNDFDYPAMYKNVHAVGKKSNDNTKPLDIIYNNNNLLLILKWNEIELFKGNSFISLYIAINHN